MDPDILKFFGVDPATFVAMSAVIYLLMNAFKEKFNIDGLGTEVVGAFISLLISLYAVLVSGVVVPGVPVWAAIFILAFLLWMVPAGVHNLVKKVKGP